MRLTFVTRAAVIAIMPKADPARVDAVLPHLVAAAVEFNINTADRIAAWLAQLAHESGELRHFEEIADGSQYEGRKGNPKPGDGKRFKGRGPIQITLRVNYEACGKALGVDLVSHPELLATDFSLACRSAGWYWKSRGLNELADTYAFGTITKRINGGFNGLDQRAAYWRAGIAFYARTA